LDTLHADVLVLAAPQFEVSKTVIKIRWLTSEELFLRHSFRVYDVAMDPKPAQLQEVEGVAERRQEVRL
jgi:hypothetical protein